MMENKPYKIILEDRFKSDYRRLKQEHPELISDLNQTITQLAMFGAVNRAYHPHVLNNRGGLYNGNMEFHLTDGKSDVLVIYMNHKTNPQIRLVRVGSHGELFQGLPR